MLTWGLVSWRFRETLTFNDNIVLITEHQIQLIAIAGANAMRVDALGTGRSRSVTLKLVRGGDKLLEIRDLIDIFKGVAYPCFAFPA